MTLHPVDLDLDAGHQTDWSEGFSIEYVLDCVADGQYFMAVYNPHYYHSVMLF